MKKRNTPSAETFTDADGQQCVRLCLSGREVSAELYADDFAALLASGVSPFWFLCWNKREGVQYVRATVPGHNKRAVARLLTRAGKGEKVTYRDGNRLNLRRGNLVIARGGSAVADCGALLAQAAA